MASKQSGPSNPLPTGLSGPLTTSQMQASLGIARRGGNLSRRARRIEAELQIQLRVMDGVRERTNHGLAQIQQIQQTAVVVYADMTNTIVTTINQPYHPEAYKYIHAFGERQIVKGGVYMEHAVDIGARHILGENDRSLYPETQPPTFWQRVFGRDDEI